MKRKVITIRPNSPADYILRALPVLAIIAVLIGAGVMTSYDLGLL